MIEDHLAKERESAIGEGERGETCEGKDQMSMGGGGRDVSSEVIRLLNLSSGLSDHRNSI